MHDFAARLFIVAVLASVPGNGYLRPIPRDNMISYTFEQPPEDNSEWTGIGGSEVSARHKAFNGTMAGWIFDSAAIDAPLSRTLPTLELGTEYTILVWTTPKNMNDPKDWLLTMTIGDDPGDHQSFVLTGAFAGDDWARWERTFIPTTTTPRLTFRVNSSLAGGYFGIDDIAIVKVGEMKKWDAISASVTALKAITAAGNYNNDLGSRVYTRLFTPAEQRGVKLPYACLPIDQESERIEYEGFQFNSTWRLMGHAFFDDNSESDPLNSAGATSAAKFRDDLIRAFMADPDLGNTVNNCEVTNIETSAGIVDDGVSEVIFTVEFMQYGGAANLAAS